MLPAIVMICEVEGCREYITTFYSGGYTHEVTLCCEFGSNLIVFLTLRGTE